MFRWNPHSKQKSFQQDLNLNHCVVRGTGIDNRHIKKNQNNLLTEQYSNSLQVPGCNIAFCLDPPTQNNGSHILGLFYSDYLELKFLVHNQNNLVTRSENRSTQREIWQTKSFLGIVCNSLWLYQTLQERNVQQNMVFQDTLSLIKKHIHCTFSNRLLCVYGLCESLYHSFFQ